MTEIEKSLCVAFVALCLYFIFILIIAIRHINKVESKNSRMTDLTVQELSLICRCISDSMNYDQKDKEDKFVILLKLKEKQLKEENKLLEKR